MVVVEPSSAGAEQFFPEAQTRDRIGISMIRKEEQVSAPTCAYAH